MFKPQPYDPERSTKQTPKQEAATRRNFRIFRLHGLHAQLGLLSGPRRELARMLIDQELIALSALTTGESQRKQQEARRRKHDRGKCADCGETFENCDCPPF